MKDDSLTLYQASKQSSFIYNTHYFSFILFGILYISVLILLIVGIILHGYIWIRYNMSIMRCI